MNLAAQFLSLTAPGLVNALKAGGWGSPCLQHQPRSWSLPNCRPRPQQLEDLKLEGSRVLWFVKFRILWNYYFHALRAPDFLLI